MSYMNDGCDPFGVPYTSNFKQKKVKKVNKNDEQYWFNGAIIFKNGKRYEIWEIVDLLNEQEETILKQKRKIKELTAQLQTEEDDVCIKCKHHYLTKKDPLHDAISNGEIVPFSSPLITIEPYYISKCKKEHDECSKENIRYCKDFELTEDTK